MDPDELAIRNRGHKLEVWKVLISMLTPLVLVALTFVVNNAIQERGARLKREEQILAEKQRIYSELGPRLNVIYVYIADIGDFRSHKPPDVVKMKREADRQFHAYLPYWSELTRNRYDEYMTAAFRMYGGSGVPARIRSSREQKVAAYKFDKLEWDSTWDKYFTEESDPEIETKYYDLVSSLLGDTISAAIPPPSTPGGRTLQPRRSLEALSPSDRDI
jgi:hypothetical protein